MDQKHPFANINLTDNVVRFVTGRYDRNPLVIQGPGAGPAVQAAERELRPVPAGAHHVVRERPIDRLDVGRTDRIVAAAATRSRRGISL